MNTQSTNQVYKTQTSLVLFINYTISFIIDNFSPSILNEIYYELHDQSAPNHSVNTNMVATRNPVLKHKYSHSNSYEGQQTTPVTQIVYRDQIHSDDLSPSVHGGVLRGSTSSSYALPPPYDYLRVIYLLSPFFSK